MRQFKKFSLKNSNNKSLKKKKFLSFTKVLIIAEKIVQILLKSKISFPTN